MKIIRAVVLAIIVSLTLLGSTATTADAGPGLHAAPITAGSASADPGDPGFPPGD